MVLSNQKQLKKVITVLEFAGAAPSLSHLDALQFDCRAMCGKEIDIQQKYTA